MTAPNDPRIDVAQTVYEFAYGIDRRDWETYRSIFVPSPSVIEFDYSSYHGRPASRMDVDAWLGAVQPLFTGLDATQHTMSNPIVELDDAGPGPARARCRVYMQAAHFFTADDTRGGGDGRRARSSSRSAGTTRTASSGTPTASVRTAG